MTPRPTLNLGILAHVDAGKTSLTERLLHDNGAIEALGSVDAGNTRTDSGELERERGITIRSAVAAFAVDGLQINLVDTPGHPDFIAEVERALSVLDAAVLVLSAVEGVQAQTRVLMRSLRRLRLPTLLFVNKIDRRGARPEDLTADIRRKLAPDIVPLATVREPGTGRARAVPLPVTSAAEVLAEHDEAWLARLVDGPAPGASETRALLAAQTTAGLVHPLLFGSALTGEGTRDLTGAVAALVRPPAADPAGPARGTVFAVERAGRGREKTAYLRLFDGEVRERRRVVLRRSLPGGGIEEYAGRIARLDVLTARAPGAARPPATVRDAGPPAEPGTPGISGGPGQPDRRGALPDDPAATGTQEPGGVLRAGGIAAVRGLPGVRVGDRLGAAPEDTREARFPPPGLETVVRPVRPGQEAALHAALTELADEDPLIGTRVAGDGQISVLLHGEVQREVVGERLRREYAVDAEFAPVTPVCFERPSGTGEALTMVDPLRGGVYWATVGLRIGPGARDSGVTFRREVEWGALPRAFHRAIEESVRRTLRQGLYGWEVTDCVVTLHTVGYVSPLSTAADFRGLTPLVLRRALEAAGTDVYEPCRRTEIEIPADALNVVTGFLTAIGAGVRATVERGGGWLVTADVPAAAAGRLNTALPGLTRGEGAAYADRGPDRRVRGTPPRRDTDGC
ncbi:TetM/TetW/TetO/TetS family tetracycline resistance ribosomal protection protein [Streptomyces sp. NBC_01497]|nr:translation factor GTPase family protein [Streptomyces sp. NBC_01497]